MTPETVSRARATDPQGLRRHLRGDLDTIVLKALRKEPERRYAGAGELAADVERHLEGNPVRARPDTARYRLSKFVRRHRAATASAATILVFLIGFAATMTVQADRVARERDHAERVSELLGDIFASANPTVVPGEDLTVREALDRGVERLRRSPDVVPQVRARLLAVIAEAYENLGALDRAIDLQSEALAMLRGTVSPQDPLFLRSLRGLGQYQARAGRADEADILLREALAIARRLGPRRASELAETLHARGYARQVAGDNSAARPLYEGALAIYRGLAEPPDSSMEATLVNLGWIAQAAGDPETAESRFREVLDLRRARLGGGHPLTARSMLALSTILLERERLEEAEPLASAALAIVRGSYPGGSADLADALRANAEVLALQGRLAEAEALQRDALSVNREVFGEEHIAVANATNSLAWLLAKQGRLDEAGALYHEAAESYGALYGEAHPFTAVVRTNVAWTEHRRGRSAEAEAIYRRALPVLDSAWAGTPAIAKSLVDFALVLRARDGCAEAERLLRRALELERESWGPDHERVVRPQRHLGACLVDLGRFEEAEPLLLDAYHKLVESRGAAHADVVQVARGLARLYELWGKDDLAVEYLRAAERGATP